MKKVNENTIIFTERNFIMNIFKKVMIIISTALSVMTFTSVAVSSASYPSTPGTYNYTERESYYMTYAYRDVIPKINNINSFAFSLAPNSEIELIIPFFINPEYISSRRLKKGHPTLVVSLYPNKKCIYLS